MSLFDDIKTGLLEAIAYEKGELKARSTKMSIAPVEDFTSLEIKELRKHAGLTQKAFALCMGVSVKTVEAWESGRNHPDGSSRRLLTLLKNDAMFFNKLNVISKQ